jgi:hypothetical protein
LEYRVECLWVTGPFSRCAEEAASERTSITMLASAQLSWLGMSAIRLTRLETFMALHIGCW